MSYSAPRFGHSPRFLSHTLQYCYFLSEVVRKVRLFWIGPFLIAAPFMRSHAGISLSQNDLDFGTSLLLLCTRRKACCSSPLVFDTQNGWYSNFFASPKLLWSSFSLLVASSQGLVLVPDGLVF